MLNRSLHHPGLRLVILILGELLVAVGLNLFIVPLSLYSGGLMGLCQLIRTLLQTYVGMDFGTHDIAGALYFVLNIPVLLLAYQRLGRPFVLRTVVCTISFSLFYSMIPTPAAPIVLDYLTACLLGGIFSGVGNGIVLTVGGSGGGLDIIGLCLSKKKGTLSVGRVAQMFNAGLYSVCLVLFNAETAIYSLIYNFFSTIVLDKMHQQNVNVQALIFTREDEEEVAQFIIEKLRRSVTYWNGVGAYTGEDIHVLCVCLSKYEVEELRQAVHNIDPHAFLTVEEGVRVYGNFSKKIG